MILSISQPTLFPWIGYFNIIKNSDIFVFLDNVKFEKRSWQMRNKLKGTANGKSVEIWVRIPTKLKETNTLIKDVLIDNSQNWKERHLNAFQSHYGDNYKNIKFLQEFYHREWDNLSEFNIQFIKKCSEFLDIKTKFLIASKLSSKGKKASLLVNICKEFCATEYLSTVGSKEYLENDKKLFEDANIKISYHKFKHPIYKQKGNKFLEKLSILDLIFNEQGNSKKFI